MVICIIEFSLISETVLIFEIVGQRITRLIRIETNSHDSLALI